MTRRTRCKAPRERGGLSARISNLDLAKIMAAAIPDEKTLERNLTEQAIRTVPRLQPFFIENWQPALLSLSIQTSVWRLDIAEAKALLRVVTAYIDGKWEAIWKEQATSNLLRPLDDQIKTIGGKAFIRLGSRSPKDNPAFMAWDLRPIPVYTPRQAVESLGYSERVYLDLGDAIRAGYSPAVCARRWIEMDPDQEFRCFIEDGKIVGITQYYLDDGYSSWVAKNAAQIEASLRGYVAMLVDVAKLPSFTADIIVQRDMRTTLLEINPPVSWGTTYPGLFIDGKLNGEFRWIRKISEEQP